MPAKNTKKITEQLFNTVIAQLKKNQGKESAARIAAANGIKPITVASIRQAQTWDVWQARKARKLERTNAVRTLDKITRSEQIIKRPVARKTAAAMKVPKPAQGRTTKLSFVSRKDLNLALKPLLERIATSERAIREMQSDSIKNDMQERRTFIARFRRGAK